MFMSFGDGLTIFNPFKSRACEPTFPGQKLTLTMLK